MLRNDVVMEGKAVHERGTLTYRPSRRQIICDELPMLTVITVIIVVTGINGIVPATLKIYSLGVAGFLTVCLLIKYLQMRAVRYEITQEQIIYVRGLINIRKDYIELYRVLSYEEHQSFMQRILHIKTVVILSGDREIPSLSVIGIPEYVDLILVVRLSAEYNKKRRGVYEITNK